MDEDRAREEKERPGSRALDEQQPARKRHCRVSITAAFGSLSGESDVASRRGVDGAASVPVTLEEQLRTSNELAHS